jgi:arylsulfatase A-like enzyme
MVIVALVAVVSTIIWRRPKPPANVLLEGDMALPLALPPCPDCNVLLITVDTVRADFVECFGAKQETMPNLCGSSRTGWLFERAISPAPATMTALTSMMTGQILSNESLSERLAFYERAPYAAELLREAGYVTGGIVDHPALGTLDAPGRQSGFLHRGFSSFLNHGVLGGADTSGQVSASAVSFLETHAKDKFLLWLHYFGPHFPYNPTLEDAERFGFDEQRCGRIGQEATIEELRLLTETITESELECVRNLHRAEMYRTDAWIAEVLDSLSTLALWDKTLVVLTADHGEEFKERNRFGHEMTVFEELVRVPLVVLHPRDRVARRLAEPMSLMSLFDWLTGVTTANPLPIRSEVFTRTHHDYWDSSTKRMRSEPNSFAAYAGDLKAMIFLKGEPAVVYGLLEDPGEMRPLAPQTPSASQLASGLTSFVDSPFSVPGVEPPNSWELLRVDMQRLENLGYFE